ncbi:MAG: NAD(P)/FAD-dependent oxidoreductase [Anaerolineae bacterium]|jgi:C-3',4' desaturase CrtD|nr:NAD(P)/FAD-dependent oxidoreductase [Anaerolineae bacterium]
MKRLAEVIVIGSGVGGLTTAALLAQIGYRVTVMEAQTYPGGSASTYSHQGFRFDSGATVVGGFQENGPHHLVGQQLGIDWKIHQHEPAWVVHLPDRQVELTRDNVDLIADFPGTEKFWLEQQQVADLAWKMSAQGLPWPPRSPAELAQLAKVAIQNFPKDLRLIPFAFGSVYDWIRGHGLQDNTMFQRFIDGQLLISAQTTAPNVNALYGATALDLARQGVYHVEGGVGGIAETLVEKLESLGGRILYRQRVTRIAVEGRRVVGVYTKKGRHAKQEVFHPADFVIANTTPWNVHQMLAEHTSPRLKREVERRKYGWGAFVLHLGVNSSALPENFPDHHQVLPGPQTELGEGRSIFVSFSPAWDQTRAPEGQRAVTITTHTEITQWWDLLERDRDAYYAKKEDYTRRLLGLMNGIIPNFSDHITLQLPGSPVTYQFYTDRHLGMVGGFPQSSLFLMRSPRTGIRNLRLVGDSIFPGQSTAGVTIGAMRVAEDVRRSLPLQRRDALYSGRSLNADPDEMVTQS